METGLDLLAADQLRAFYSRSRIRLAAGIVCAITELFLYGAEYNGNIGFPLGIKGNKPLLTAHLTAKSRKIWI